MLAQGIINNVDVCSLDARELRRVQLGAVRESQEELGAEDIRAEATVCRYCNHTFDT
jgi:hypothetical protein